MRTRMSRDLCFMVIALTVAERSTCNRAKVGAVLVDNRRNRIVGMGYNGSVSGAPHCIDVGCLMSHGHCKRTIHAEENAVLNLEHFYSNLTLYSTHQPCAECYKRLVAANVKAIFYLEPYKDRIRDKLIKELKNKAPLMVKL